MVTQRERLIAQGKRQVLLWLNDQAVERLKAICTRERCTQQELVERLIMGYSAQPETAADSSGGDSIDRLAGSIAGLSDEFSQLGGAVRDMATVTDDRLNDVETRLQHLEATITLWQCTGTTPEATPETPVSAAPGGNEAPGPKPYYSDKKNEIEARRARFIALHNEGLSTTGISHAIKKEGYTTGTSPGEIDLYLRAQGLTPHRMRG